MKTAKPDPALRKSSKVIRVLLVDDHAVVRQGLRGMLDAEEDIQIVGEAEDGLKAVEMAKKLRPDVITMDMGMPRMNGLEATHQILKTFPGTRILLLSAYDDPAYIKQAKAFGAAGYLIKQSSLEILSKVIREVHNGADFFDPVLSRLQKPEKKPGKEGDRRRKTPAEESSEAVKQSGMENLDQQMRTEISERRVMEVALSHLAAIVEYSSDAIIGKDLNSVITSWNKGAEKIFGYTAEEMVGTSIMRLIPDDRQYEEEIIIRKVSKGETLEHFETVRRTKDGRFIDISVTVSPIKDSSGRIVGVSKVARDVTETKQTRILLDRMSSIVEYSSDAIIGKDLNSIITSWNKGAEKIFGYTAEEMVGTSIMRLIPDDRQHEEGIIIGKVSKGETLEHFETVRRTKDGRFIDISVTVSPIKDSSGHIVGVSKVARDITETRRAAKTEQELAVVTASNLKLEQEVSRREEVEQQLLKSEQYQKLLQERARHLAHRILHTQEQERLRISRELHDQVVQNLIGVNVRLIGLARQSKTLNPDFQQQIVFAQQLVEKSVDTIHEVARELRPTVLDDLGLIPTLNTYLAAFTKETGVRVNLTIYAEVEKLHHVVLTTLYRVAQEALQNVSRHSKADTVEMKIQKLSRQVCMTIKDNGKGFNSDPKKNAKKGKRLGLVGMQERLEMVGGAFEIKSKEGKGTLVTAFAPISYIEIK